MSAPLVEYVPPIRRINRGRGHSYEDAVGRKVPGVTSVLKALPKDGLIAWAANATADYALDHWRELATSRPSERIAMLRRARFEVVNQASSKGTTVHRLAEKLVMGHAVGIPDGLEGYVDAYVEFLDAHDFQAEHVEGVVSSMHDPVYAGTFDVLGKLTADFGDGPFRSRWLLDIKTGKGVYGEAALQIAGYRYAPTLNVNGQDIPMPDVDNCGVVHLSQRQDRDGKWVGSYRLLPVDAGQRTWELFERVYRQFEVLDELQYLVGDAALPPTTTRRMRLTPVEPAEQAEGSDD